MNEVMATETAPPITPEIASLEKLMDDRPGSSETGEDVAHTKRFIERFLGDAQFRCSARGLMDHEVEIGRFLAAFGLHIDPTDAQAYVRMNTLSEETEETPALRRFREFTRAAARNAEDINAIANRSSNRFYTAWRQRQLGALRFQFSSAAELVVHPLAAFELSRGCSVGCWFCAVGAEKLQSHFLATQENLALFRTVQQAMRESLGEASGAAMCYWATDALDNPDYEAFADVFRETHGVFPPTTTAISWKNPERTRELLRTSASFGTRLNRFSVLSVGMLNRIHAAFTPEELLHTELVFQMPEALVPLDILSSAPARKIRAGRARDLKPEDARVYDEGAGTVACVIGFLVNLVDRSIRLIAPTVPSEAWPLGYRTLARADGFTAESFGTHVERMIQEHMQPGFSERPIRMADHIGAEVMPERLYLHTPMHAVTIVAPGLPAETLSRLVESLRSGSLSGSELSFSLRSVGVSLLRSQSLLHTLRAEGVFETA